MLLHDVMECGDDSSSDWLDHSTVTTDPNYAHEIVSSSTEASTSKNGKRIMTLPIWNICVYPLIFYVTIKFSV